MRQSRSPRAASSSARAAARCARSQRRKESSGARAPGAFSPRIWVAVWRAGAAGAASGRADLLPVLLLVVLAVGAAARALDPLAVPRVPVYRLPQPGLPRLARPPVEFRLHLPRVDGVAAV